MASTLTPDQALYFAKTYIKSMRLDDVRIQSRILNEVSAWMWMAAPWRWTLGTLGTNIALATGTTDYAVTLPSDFLYLIDVQLADGQTTPRHLHIDPYLPTSEVQQGLVSRAAIIGSATLRVYPKPGTQPASPPVMIPVYKKIAPVITSATMDTAGVQVFDDEWFQVYCEGVLWRAYQYSDDQRAGSVTVTTDSAGKLQIEFTGQRAAFEAALEQMKTREKLPVWDYRQPPDQETRNK